ncbi:MAG TPA: aminotransferase class I/II-fold pyridoxal phosphate-dependent enzyme [Candidatus Baltobacteraceae bacterium]|jgi:methionine-gamma-lyase|nr:aminotransferase class I/II-fold pyridoxal phosphate-dependent enzyme [Candidatus Baltobacteraceae bacterium]
MTGDGLGIETRLMHADRTGARGANVTPPIYQTSTFAIDDPEAMARGASTPSYETFYTRHGNPNHGDAERVVASIEGGEAALVAGSGMGAISTTAIALVSAGDHIVAQTEIYSGTRHLLTWLLPRFGVDVTFVQQTDVAGFESAMRSNTKLVMLETPSNPLLGITDLRAVSNLGHAAGALVCVDNTIATPVNQRPLEAGVDVVVHSATKYLGGHSDLVAGAVVASRELIDRIWKMHIVIGATLGPFEAWLLLRGLRTLEMRVQQHNRNAQAIAEYLNSHRRVRTVYYPGLPSHPGHALAKTQMSGFGGLLSFEIEGGFDDARRAIDRMRLIHSAVSLGGVESLVAQPAAMWPDVAKSDRAREMGAAPSLVRLSVGCEQAGDLIADLEQSLA